MTTLGPDHIAADVRQTQAALFKTRPRVTGVIDHGIHEDQWAICREPNTIVCGLFVRVSRNITDKHANRDTGLRGSQAYAVLLAHDRDHPLSDTGEPFIELRDRLSFGPQHGIGVHSELELV